MNHRFALIVSPTGCDQHLKISDVTLNSAWRHTHLLTSHFIHSVWVLFAGCRPSVCSLQAHTAPTNRNMLHMLIIRISPAWLKIKTQQVKRCCRFLLGKELRANTETFVSNLIFFSHTINFRVGLNFSFVRFSQSWSRATSRFLRSEISSSSLHEETRRVAAATEYTPPPFITTDMKERNVGRKHLLIFSFRFIFFVRI